jgi:hypothetical protein
MIVDRKAFILGLLLCVSFFGVLALIFTPAFDGGRNGLQYADDIFNRLSKGSSYFIPKVAKKVEAVAGSELKLTIRLEKEDMAAAAEAMLGKSGVAVRLEGTGLTLDGNFGQLLGQVLRDAEDGYRNAGAALTERYGMPERASLATWWQVLLRMDKVLKQEKRLVEANAVHEVMKKAVEPAHNYYGIEAEHVGDMAGTMIALLGFYVLYTIWWGYAIFFLFENIGLVMKRKTTGK